MVQSGDWLFPHRGIELYSDKPPMLMWLQAAFYTVFGNWRVAFLLPSLLAALGTLWCVQDLGRRLWTRKVGLYASWALLFAFQFWLGYRSTTEITYSDLLADLEAGKIESVQISETLIEGKFRQAQGG